MKPINLLALTQAFTTLDAAAYEKFAAFHGIKIKPSEVEDLNCLIDCMRCGGYARTIFDGFYVGYRIPQIGKEFDLLRFGENYNVNIEIKSNLNKERMLSQLARNKYYLGYLGKPLHSISFSSLNNQFYRLENGGALLPVSVEEVFRLLAEQDVEASRPIDDRFLPSNYLVSPFNSPERFLAREYFLTSQQEEVKSQVMKSLSTVGMPSFISLTGSAGTGKTLLAYDIVADLIGSGWSPLIVHCGNLNGGHHELIRRGWRIIPIKQIGQCDLRQFNIVLIDEAQRIRPNQYSDFVNHVRANNGKCIFSFDKSQTLADSEARRNVSANIEEISEGSRFALSEKIRTNKEIATFIKGFFNISRKSKTPDTGNIEIIFFGSLEDAKDYISAIDESEWKVLRFTPSQYTKEHHEAYSSNFSSTSHEVIGQEFDAVAVVVDQFFTYNEQGVLIYTGPAYYQPVKMLFQNMTRSRIKLRIVIINNPVVLDACLKILQ